MATEASKPQYKKQSGTPDQLPQGAAKQLNASANLLPTEDPLLQASSEDQPLQGKVTDFDDVLFSGTDHPNEPVTTGAPFGPGANYVRNPEENDAEFLQRAAVQIAASPNATSRVKAFAARMARGE